MERFLLEIHNDDGDERNGDVETNNALKLHRMTQIMISLGFQSCYLLLYGYILVAHIRPIWSGILRTIKTIIILFGLFLLVDFLGVLIALTLILTDKVSRQRGYESQLVVKLLIRRVS